MFGNCVDNIVFGNDVDDVLVVIYYYDCIDMLFVQYVCDFGNCG